MIDEMPDACVDGCNTDLGYFATQASCTGVTVSWAEYLTLRKGVKPWGCMPHPAINILSGLESVDNLEDT